MFVRKTFSQGNLSWEFPLCVKIIIKNKTTHAIIDREVQKLKTSEVEQSKNNFKGNYNTCRFKTSYKKIKSHNNNKKIIVFVALIGLL